MTEPVTTGALFALIKSLFPGAVGAAVAVWYKRKDVDWVNLTKGQKSALVLLALGAFVVGVTVSHYGGGALNEMLNVKAGSLTADLVKAAIGLASLKIVDAFMANVDRIINALIRRLTDLAKGGNK